MISCQQRKTERAKTLSQLAYACYYPLVVESPCNPAGGPLNRLASWEAINLIGRDNDGLFFEDDIDIDRTTFRFFVEQAEKHQNVTTFTCFRKSLHPDGILQENPARPRLVRLQNTKQRYGFYGTQAMYFPSWAINHILNHKEDFVTSNGSPLESCDGFDFWIKEHFDTILMAFPNPVQHRAPMKMKHVSRGIFKQQNEHRSLTYHFKRRDFDAE